MQSLSGEPTDQALVAQILRDGNELAFRSLYGRYTPRLNRLALNLSGGRSLNAEDLVQDTWLRAAARLKDFEWRSSLITWLSGILLNLVREAHRAAGRMPFIELTDEVPEWPAPPDLVDRLELERALAALAPGHRAVLVLHDIEGYTHEEIAGFLDISPGTSKSQLCRARRALLAFLSNEGRKRHHVRT